MHPFRHSAMPLRSAGARSVRAPALVLLCLLGACVGPIPPRRVDHSRPALTPERVARVVEVSRRLRPHHPELADFLDDPDPSIGMDLETREMIPAEDMVGADGVAALTAMGEDPRAYVRDVFWIRLTTFAIGKGGVDESMRKTRKVTNKLAPLALLSREMAALRDNFHRLLLLHASITPGEEQAVRSRQAEIDQVTFLFRKRLAAMRDSMARLNGSMTAQPTAAAAPD